MKPTHLMGGRFVGIGGPTGEAVSNQRFAEGSAPSLRSRQRVRIVLPGDALKRKLKLSGRIALSSVAAAVLCLASPLASALGLGRLSVQSSLGEVLRAEIEVTSLTPEEQASLRIRVASPEAYRSANVDYNPVLPSTRASFEKRADGRLFVRLVSDRGVQEPFVDVILEISWATGRLVREYTLLFDPPATVRAAAPPTPGSATAPVMSAAPAAPAPLPPSTPSPASARETRESAREAARAEARERRAAARSAAAEARAPQDASASAKTAGASEASGDEYRVRSGDSLSKIAGKTQRAGVSLDQMLVSLFRANPSAFSGSNMNRLKAGVVLSVPSAESAQGVTPGEARQTITAQSADFGAYRQRLASSTLSTTPRAEASSRQGTGKVQAAIEDKKQAANATADKLKLSKGATPPSAAGSAEDRLSAERERQAAAARVAELNKNVTDLKKMQGAASQPATTIAAAPTAPPVRPAPPAVVVPTPVPTPSIAAPPPVASAVAAAPAASVAVAAASVAAVPALPVPTASSAVASSASSPPIAARTPASAAPKPAPRPAARPAPEPSFIDSITSGNPLYLGLGALALLVVGYAGWRYTQRSKKDSGETSFLESRLQPDSFFGASGGQRIDTRDAGGSSSSMTYSLSQLDAIGDVDPVAEADVYLAYGRDLQAEEILKEAMRSNPERLAIRTKLLEVYAKRRDIKGFELLATQLYALTRGEGEDWAKAQELGSQIDPDNAMYRVGGAPERPVEGGEIIEGLGASTMPQSIMPVPSQFGQSLGDTVPRDSDSIDLDLDNPDIGSPSRPAALDSISPPAADLSNFNTTVKMPLVANEAGVAVPDHRDEPLAFDLSGITLDLDHPATSVDEPTTAAGNLSDGGSALDPLARKLELAEEFQRIGDKDGARDLLREVLATASGATKTKAQGMLDSLS
jgi:pilus assembly protein FimV